MQQQTKHIILVPVIGLLALLISSCGGSNDPVPEPVPQGEWYRTTAMSNNRVHRSMIILARDSACISDSVFSFPNGVETLDSTHEVRLELSPAGDGYSRAVEEHVFNGSDVVEEDLRYWFFFVRDDSLRFYNGMRFRGRNTGLKGDWNLSAADSAFLGRSYSYSFDGENVKITWLSPGGVVTDNHSYSVSSDTLNISGDNIPPYGNRFEVVPGLALYITAHSEAGYGKSAP